MTKRKGTASKRSVSTATARAATAPQAQKGSAGASGPPHGFDLKLLRDLARIANEYDLESIELNPDGGVCITRVPASSARVASAPVVAAAPLSLVAAPSPSAQDLAKATEKAVEDGVLIASPFVGTFYRAANPESAPFVEVGQTVRKGQVVCIVEAMKLMNEIEAEADGKLIEVLVKNGEHVEYGQPLFRLEKI
ncbi:MAG: acetyl-CoA carboxylase biotin carboxyl carrier protein [Myxococcales bacterium]|nr:acetyl-CoA carboxylase biotin carboxyl carrier protein [Myxococcales bacterium]